MKIKKLTKKETDPGENNLHDVFERWTEKINELVEAVNQLSTKK